MIGRVSIVLHDGKPRAVELRDEVQRFLHSNGIALVDKQPDLVVSLGGDGTMLRAARAAHAADAPLLGVNLGTLGYLTETDAADWQPALQQVLDGQHHIEHRMMLACRVSTGGKQIDYVGLNEVLVERVTRHRLVRLVVKIGGESLAAFNADGIIVATPTGSTAYALSAGGPIVSPQAECMVVVPVSPHMIFSRPFVLSQDATVELALEGEEQEASVSLDGALGCDLGSGAMVLVRRHPQPLRLARLAGPGFIERLRSKLGLPGAGAEG